MTDRHRQALLASLVASSEQLMKACNVARDAGQDELADAIYQTGRLVHEQIRMVTVIAQLTAAKEAVTS